LETADGTGAGCTSQRTALCHTQSCKKYCVNTPHVSVLYKEIIHALQPKSGGRYVDGTLGAGGHARGIMEASAPDGQLLGLDVDPQALALARKPLATYERRT